VEAAQEPQEEEAAGREQVHPENDLPAVIDKRRLHGRV